MHTTYMKHELAQATDTIGRAGGNFRLCRDKDVCVQVRVSVCGHIFATLATTATRKSGAWQINKATLCKLRYLCDRIPHLPPPNTPLHVTH